MVNVPVQGDVAVQRCALCASPVPDSATTCPTCGAPLNGTGDSGRSASGVADVLPTGTQLNRSGFSIGRVLGRGGFGITYLGADLRLKRAVAIKEFFPSGSTRQGRQVVVPSTFSRVEYDLALQRFMQQAQVLARFRHSSIVNVYEVFQENDTAYMVMEYLQGETLLERMERTGGPLGEAELVAITGPVSEALGEVHAAGVLHRDIKPENIMLVGPRDSPRPVLIDFGAAREFASGMVNRHSIVLTPGYAPLEQYSEQARRGPFTDVYALAATLYHVATGQQPPAATERALGVALKPPRELNAALGPSFDAAIVHGMQMKVDERPQTATEFYRELAGDVRPPEATPVPAPGPATFDRAPALPRNQSPSPPSPALPGTGRHIDRVRQIARELSGMGAIQTDRFLCPVCRSADMLDAARTVAGTRCPVCRAAVLQERFSASDMLLCPSCSSGTLQTLTSAPVRPDSLMRCPACRVGSVVTYVRSQMLFVPDLWARCDNCGADFDYHMQTDSLTLSDLPNGPGQLNGDWVGQTRTRTEWAAMAGEDVAGATCPVCGAEFTTCDGGDLQWISRAGDPEGVPPEHRGKCRSRVAWAKVAHHIGADHGTIVCPSCDAQFDESDTAQLTLLSAPRDPHGTLARHRGRTYPAAKWRAMATGRTGTSLAGLVCPSCASELQQTRRQDSYALAWFDGARDPYGTGHRYQNQALSSDDWRRIAAGGVPRAEEQRLRQEIHQEFWAAMRAGEVSTSSAEESFPESRSADEKIVITFPVMQVRSRFGFLYERDGGNVWLTTRRLVYEGDRDTMSLELADTQPARVLDGGQGSPVVEIGTADRRREFRFVMGSGPIAFEVERVTLQLQWDESAFAELFQSLRGRA